MRRLLGFEGGPGMAFRRSRLRYPESARAGAVGNGGTACFAAASTPGVFSVLCLEEGDFFLKPGDPMKPILLQRVSAFVLGVGLTLLMAAGTASARDARKAPGVKPATGTASWFGQWHHGKSTASGEPFDMYAMTAAHRKLPFGTVLKVTNTRNGMDVVVRVNDRGPYAKKRILDLSYAAADRLDMRVSGTAPVVLEVVGDVQGRPLKEDQAFFVRLAEQKSASTPLLEQQMARLIRVGFQDAATLLHTTDDAVALGPFDDFQAAQETLVRVATLHPRASIMLADKSQARPVVSTVASAPSVTERTSRLW